METFEPPPHPPPLLSDTDIQTFAQQGHLDFFLSYDHALLIEKTFAIASDFFAQEASFKSQKYPQSQGTELGYSLLAGEKEYLTLRWLPPDTQDPLECAVKELWRASATLLHRILVDLSFAMNVDCSAWDPLLDGCLEIPSKEQDRTPTLLRIFNYFPESGTAGRHVDNGILTLCISAEAGLQVLDIPQDARQTSSFSSSSLSLEGEKWRAVEGATLLAGSTLQVFSRNRIRAGVHRVASNNTGRSSIVFALRPSLRNRFVDFGKFGGEEGEKNDIRDLYKRIKEGRHNVNAPKELREQQKKEQQEKFEKVAQGST